MTDVNWFFVALAQHAREHGGDLEQWLSTAETAAALDSVAVRHDDRGRFPRPDGAGTWVQGGHRVEFLLENDTGTGYLPALAGILDRYQALAAAMAWQERLYPLLLFCFTSPRREQAARQTLGATREASSLRIATAAIDPRVTSPAGAVWMPLLPGTRRQVPLIDLDTVIPGPWGEYRQERAQERRPAELPSRQRWPRRSRCDVHSGRRLRQPNVGQRREDSCVHLSRVWDHRAGTVVRPASSLRAP